MTKKQYKNIIDWTVEHNEAARSEDSLTAARAIFNNLGVALPQGDCKDVKAVLASNDYMGWRACSAEEAQEAANRGTSAIGINDEHIVIIAAEETSEENNTAAAETAAVMTLGDIEEDSASEMQYFAYNYGDTNNVGGESTISPRTFNSNYLINQGNTNILYPSGEQPGSETRVFLDSLFYRNVCGKTAASGTIKQYGCAICSIAMFLLFKGNIVNSNNNTYYAVKAATIQGTNNSADFTWGNADVSYNNGYSQVTADVSVTSNADSDLSSGKCCIFRIREIASGKTHYVLVYGIDYSKNGTDKYKVADPNGGRLCTLSDAIQKIGLTASMDYITEKFVIE